MSPCDKVPYCSAIIHHRDGSISWACPTCELAEFCKCNYPGWPDLEDGLCIVCGRPPRTPQTPAGGLQG